jgi:HAD superfamily hydrolase (TIGR01450 family)
MSGRAVRDLLGRKSRYIVDLDGVVYHGSKLVPGAGRAIRLFREKGKRVLFLTNNSSRRPADIAEKLAKLGVPCSSDDVVNSALGAAMFIREKRLDRPRGTLAIGTDGLRATLKEYGIAVSTDERTCSSLLVGMDPGLDYQTIALGLRVLNRGVPFIVCNRDANYPGDGGVPVPGCGALVGALVGASQRSPDHEIGKPSPRLLRLALGRLRARPAECLVFGDTLETDIEMAAAAGIDSVWIIPRRKARRSSGAKPTARLDSLAAAAALLDARN